MNLKLIFCQLKKWLRFFFLLILPLMIVIPIPHSEGKDSINFWPNRKKYIVAKIIFEIWIINFGTKELLTFPLLMVNIQDFKSDFSSLLRSA